jgi:hypothetical protein
MTDMPLPTGPKVLAIGTRILSKVTYAVPAAEEYAVFIGLVDTPDPRGISITVNPVFKDFIRLDWRRDMHMGTYIRSADSGEVVSEGSICNPPVIVTVFNIWILYCESATHFLVPVTTQ